jgi:hypothetical protein
MAILNSGLTQGEVVDGTLIVVRPNKSTTAQRANNNRSGGSHGVIPQSSSPSQTFSTLDQLIRSLDATYQLSVPHSVWEAYAANIAGEWLLCANCPGDTGAQPLFRMYNMYRYYQGLPRLDLPVDNAEHSPGGHFHVDVFNDQHGGPLETNLTPSVAGGTNVSIAQVGLGLANPVLDWKGNDESAHNTSGPFFDWPLAVLASLGLPVSIGSNYSLEVNVCWCTEDGAPGLPNSMAFDVFVN